MGRHLVEVALARGDEVTLFNRGQSNPDLFPQVEELRGDRDGGLDVLRGRRWDAVVDTSGYVPRLVGQSASLLADSVEHYTFVSSISVYADWSRPGIAEGDPVEQLEDETVEEVTGETYGALKALCEEAVEAAMPGRALNVRAGLIVGPYDGSDRFPYWVHRMARGGRVLAPGRPENRVQIIDARDLAGWILRMAEAREAGVFNATGPDEPLTMGTLLQTCGRAAGSQADLVWVAADFLTERGVQPFGELPLWLPGEEGAGWAQVDIGKAVTRGLTFRPLMETAADTLAWLDTRPDDHTWRAGLDPDRESALLREWRDARQAPAS